MKNIYLLLLLLACHGLVLGLGSLQAKGSVKTSNGNAGNLSM